MHLKTIRETVQEHVKLINLVTCIHLKNIGTRGRIFLCNLAERDI